MGADLFDRLAIRDLVERYAALVDERRPEDAAALFVEDGELLVPAPPRHLGPTVPHRGRAEVAAAMAALGAFTATFHAVHGAVVDLDAGADEATGRVTCTAHHLSAGDLGAGGAAHRDLVWHLVYRDRYRRDGGTWRFTRRELQVVSIETSTPRAVGVRDDVREEQG